MGLLAGIVESSVATLMTVCPSGAPRAMAAKAVAIRRADRVFTFLLSRWVGVDGVRERKRRKKKRKYDFPWLQDREFNSEE